MNQNDLGNSIRLSRSAIASIETGQNKVTAQTKFVMELLFDVNPEYWTGADQMFLPKEKPGHDPIYEQIIEQKDEEIKMLKRIVELLEDKVADMAKQSQKKS